MNISAQLFRVTAGSFLAAAALLSNVVFGAGQVAASDNSGAVFVLTNDTANAVAVFNRAGDGSLTAAGTVSTGGAGSVAALGSQGALALSANRKLLFAVNAGSSEISSFTIKNNVLTFAAKVPSNGVHPISLALRGDVLYVLNQGDAASPGNISGFNVSKKGEIWPIAGSIQPLSSNAPGSTLAAAQVSFDNDGENLIVTEKNTNKIDIYKLDDDTAQAPAVFSAQGVVPYGFAISKRNDLIVSEAGTGAVSSYDISDGTLQVITPSSSTLQAAPCWLVVTKNGRFVYTANAGSGTITGYSVKRDGTLALLSANGISAATAPNVSPLDMGISKDSGYLYVLTRDPATNLRGLSAFAVVANGSLIALPNIAASLPTFAASVAAY